MIGLGMPLLMWAGDPARPATGSALETILKIAPLLPALLAFGYKWASENGRDRRRTNLIERMATLAKNIAELPQLPGESGDATTRVRDAFQAELEGSYHELVLLQAHAPHRTFGVSSVTLGLKSAFLFFRPRGFKAWILHIAFYVSLVLLAFLTLGFAVEKSAEHTATAIAQQAKEVDSSGTDAQDEPISPGVIIAIYVLFGTPPVVFRYFAMKIHRRQCAPISGGDAL
jgi:hypothetical protein